MKKKKKKKWVSSVNKIRGTMLKKKKKKRKHKGHLSKHKYLPQ